MRILSPTENKRFNELVGFRRAEPGVPDRAEPALLFSARRIVQRVRAAARALVRRATGSVRSARTWPICSFNSAALARFCFRSAMFLVAMRWFRSQLWTRRSQSSSARRCCSLSLSAELTLDPHARGSRGFASRRIAGQRSRARFARGAESARSQSGFDCPDPHFTVPDHQFLSPRRSALDEEAHDH